MIAKRTILLVEGEARIAAALKKAMKVRGYNVIMASNGERAVEATRDNPGIDLILMDANPGQGMGGAEAARAILRDRDIPILFLLSRDEEYALDEMEDIPCYGYAARDAGETVLLASIGAALRLHEVGRPAGAPEHSPEVLRESEQRFRILAGAIEEVFWLADVKIDTMFYVSPGYERVWGRSRQSLFDNPKSFIDAVHPDDRPRLAASLEGGKSGQPFEHEYRIILPDGSVRWIWDRGFPIRSDRGLVTGYAGLASDVTERKETVDALRRRENWYRSLFETSPEGIFVVCQETGDIVAANDAACRLYGYTEDEFLSMKNTDVSAEPEKTRTAVDARKTVVPLRYHRKKDGSVFPVEITGGYFEDGCRRLHTAFIRDITDRRETEEALRDSEAVSKALLDIPQDSVMVLMDRHGALIDCNRSLSERLGKKVGEMRGKCVFDFLPPDVAELRRTKFEESLRTGKPLRYEDENHGRFYESVHYPIFDGRGDVDKVLVFAYDITSLKKTEKALRESEEKYRSIFENAVEGFFQTTPEGRYQSANPALARIYGYDSPEELMSTVTDLGAQQYVVPEDRARFKEAFAAHGLTEGFETQLYRKDGSIVWTSLSARAVKDGEGAILYYEGTALDITEQKRAHQRIEAALKEKETLLKEIHHRVKINLQVMSSLLNLQSQYLDDPEARKVFRVSMDRVKTMALIHDKLYRSENLSHIYFPEYVKDLARDLIGTYATGRAVALKLDVHPVSLDIDTAIPVGLIINELVSNSLKHGFSGAEEGTLKIGLQAEGPHIALVISDNGIGFPENLNFRDTQSLGMQLVTTLVDQLEGTMELRRGNGTEFRIVFPASR